MISDVFIRDGRGEKGHFCFRTLSLCVCLFLFLSRRSCHGWTVGSVSLTTSSFTAPSHNRLTPSSGPLIRFIFHRLSLSSFSSFLFLVALSFTDPWSWFLPSLSRSGGTTSRLKEANSIIQIFPALMMMTQKTWLLSHILAYISMMNMIINTSTKKNRMITIFMVQMMLMIIVRGRTSCLK